MREFLLAALFVTIAFGLPWTVSLAARWYLGV